MDDDQLLRYSRHILLPEIGIEGQRALLAAHVLIVGAGGLGSPAALYLAAAGIGTLTVCDHDRVELSNLQRQILHPTPALGTFKAESARAALALLNPGVAVHAIAERLDGARLEHCVREADVVLDCSDNFATRQALNRACVTLRTPLVSGAALGFEGQIAVFDLRAAGAPCYACLFPETSAGDDEEQRCATAGVFAPLTGIIGSMQAAETLKLLAGLTGGLAGRLLRLDARAMRWREAAIVRDPACAVCGSV